MVIFMSLRMWLRGEGGGSGVGVLARDGVPPGGLGLVIEERAI